jgi:HK97 family phage major capsid protein
MARLEELKNELAATIFYGEGLAEKLQDPGLSEAERADISSDFEAVEVKAQGLGRDIEKETKDVERNLRINAIGRDMNVQRPDEPEPVEYKSPVDALFDNPEFKAAAADKTFRDTKRFDTGLIEFKAPVNPTVTNPDDLVQNLRPGIVQPFVYPQRIGALFNNATMDGSSISWLDVSSADGKAGYAGYGTQKPGPAAVNVDVHTTKAAKIATTYTVPDDALDDLTALRSTIESVMLNGPAGLGVIAEQEYLGGSGTGTPLELAGVDQLSPTNVTGNGSNFVSDIFFAALDIEAQTGAPATAAVVNPIDYFQIITLEGDDGRPLFAPFGGVYQDPNLGFPIVRSKAVANGTIYVGAWNLAILYTRQAVNIRATSEGIGLADKNLTMFVAETRQALIHPYGKAPFRLVSMNT